MDEYLKREFKYRRAVAVMKAIAHPTRLMILNAISKKTECVRDFEEAIGKKQANISQHLSILRAQGIIDYIQEGRKRCYYLKMPGEIKEILRCVDKMR